MHCVTILSQLYTEHNISQIDIIVTTTLPMIAIFLKPVRLGWQRGIHLIKVISHISHMATHISHRATDGFIWFKTCAVSHMVDANFQLQASVIEFPMQGLKMTVMSHCCNFRIWQGCKIGMDDQMRLQGRGIN